MRTATSSNPAVRILALAIAILGGVFFVAGAVTYGAVASNLKAENITVSPDAAHFGGALVDTPWEAFAQADIINHHALTATDGKTYAELGAELHAIEADNPDATKEELAANPDYAKATALRTVVMNGSFLRASLFTSVIAFGVGALVMGLGVVIGTIGAALLALTPKGGKVVATDVKAPELA